MNFLEKKANVAEILMDAIEKTAQQTDYHTPDSLAALAQAYASVCEHGRNRPDPNKSRGATFI